MEQLTLPGIALEPVLTSAEEDVEELDEPNDADRRMSLLPFLVEEPHV